MHLSLDGQHLKILPSRMTSTDLARLRAQGARPAGPPPARPSWTQLTASAPVEIHRTVNAVGTVSIVGKPHSIGQHFAGRRITLRLETTLAHVVVDGVLARTIPRTLSPAQRARLQGARTPRAAPTLDQRPTRVQRTVFCRGGTQIIGQRVQVGLRYAGQIVTIEVDDTTLRVYDQRNQLIKTVPRTSRKEVTRHKAYGPPPTAKPARHRHPSPETKTAPIIWDQTREPGGRSGNHVIACLSHAERRTQERDQEDYSKLF